MRFPCARNLSNLRFRGFSGPARGIKAVPAWRGRNAATGGTLPACRQRRRFFTGRNAGCRFASRLPEGDGATGAGRFNNVLNREVLRVLCGRGVLLGSPGAGAVPDKLPLPARRPGRWWTFRAIDGAYPWRRKHLTPNFGGGSIARPRSEDDQAGGGRSLGNVYRLFVGSIGFPHHDQKRRTVRDA